MAIKNLQFVVTVAVDVPEDWECPPDAAESIEDGLVCRVMTDANIEEQLGGKITNINALFETVTD